MLGPEFVLQSGTESLTFVGTKLSWIVSTSVVLIAFVVCLLAWKRQQWNAKVGLLEGLRFLVILLMAIALNQPEMVEEFRETKKPQLVVLYDDSGSMDTQDVLLKEGQEPLTRRESIQEWTDPATFDSLSDKWEVVVSAFAGPVESEGVSSNESSEDESEAEEPSGISRNATDINGALEDAMQEYENLRGVVMISDGDWNEGGSPVQTATRLRVTDVPIYTIPVGSQERLPDIEVLSLDAPTFGVQGKPMRVPFSIDSALPLSYSTQVTLSFSDGQTLVKDVRIPAMSRMTDWVTWEPMHEGDFTVKLEVPKHPEEALSENNQLEAPVSIRKEQLKVLVVESYPRWEYRYLRNALSRDPGVEVSCLLFHPDLAKMGGGQKDYLKAFPSKEDLSEYDVIFLGDIGVGASQLTDEQCRLIKGVVEQQASGLVFLPGWQGRQLSLLETELDALYPVQLDLTKPDGWGTRTPSHFELTEKGRSSHLTKLADTENENAQVWQRLPGFQWYAPVERARAGTEVLCVHKEVQNQYGRLPLLVTRTFGNGKVLFMGTDGAWRWRRGVEDLYHYRFWGQVVRWMAYQRNMAEGETMRLFYSPERPRTFQTMTFHANVMGTDGEPLQGAKVKLHLQAPSGVRQTVHLASAGEGWGAYTGLLDVTEAGKYEARLHCEETGALVETSIFVLGENKEKLGQPARPDVLREISQVTKGRVLPLDDVEQTLTSLASVPDPEPEIRRSQLWSHPWLAGLTVLLLAIFWVGRKWIGEI